MERLNKLTGIVASGILLISIGLTVVYEVPPRKTYCLKRELYMPFTPVFGDFENTAVRPSHLFDSGGLEKKFSGLRLEHFFSRKIFGAGPPAPGPPGTLDSALDS